MLPLASDSTVRQQTLRIPKRAMLLVPVHQLEPLPPAIAGYQHRHQHLHRLQLAMLAQPRAAPPVRSLPLRQSLFAFTTSFHEPHREKTLARCSEHDPGHSGVESHQVQSDKFGEPAPVRPEH